MGSSPVGVTVAVDSTVERSAVNRTVVGSTPTSHPEGELMSRKTMKLLVHEGKYGNAYIVIDDNNEDAAWLAMFRWFDEREGFYCGLHGDQLECYNLAKAGNAKAARWLLDLRSNYEYEKVTLEHAETTESLLQLLDK